MGCIACLCVAVLEVMDGVSLGIDVTIAEVQPRSLLQAVAK